MELAKIPKMYKEGDEFHSDVAKFEILWTMKGETSNSHTHI